MVRTIRSKSAIPFTSLPTGDHRLSLLHRYNSLTALAGFGGLSPPATVAGCARMAAFVRRGDPPVDFQLSLAGDTPLFRGTVVFFTLIPNAYLMHDVSAYESGTPPIGRRLSGLRLSALQPEKILHHFRRLHIIS
jgi:hypothetical protein